MSDLLSLPLPHDGESTNDGTPFVTRPKYVRAWRWTPEFNEQGNIIAEKGSIRPADPREGEEWRHPSGVITPDNGNPSWCVTRAGIERPANGDIIVVHEDGTRSIYKPATFLQEYEPV